MLGEKRRVAVMAGVLIALSVALLACAPPKSEPVKTVNIPDGEIDPEVWGKAYPEEYELWKKTEEPAPAGKSKYKRGFDADRITYDKLSEFPYMALLFNGWGFGVEYNEPRGHAYMVRDQLEVDASRLKAGGVCLTCKTPYAPLLQQEMGADYYKSPFKEVLGRIPKIPKPGRRLYRLPQQQGYVAQDLPGLHPGDRPGLARHRAGEAHPPGDALGRLRPVPRHLQHPQGRPDELRWRLLSLAERRLGGHHYREHHQEDSK